MGVDSEEVGRCDIPNTFAMSQEALRRKFK